MKVLAVVCFLAFGANLCLARSAVKRDVAGEVGDFNGKFYPDYTIDLMLQ